MSDKVLIHIDLQQAIRMGIRFFLVSKPTAASHSSRPSLHYSDSPSSQIRPPLPTETPISTKYKNKLTWIITPGNEFGFLPPECFSKVEVVRIRRKVLSTLNQMVVKQKPSNEKKEVNLDSNMGSTVVASKYRVVDTRSERGMNELVEVTEKNLDQFYIDLPIDRQSRVVHSDLRKEALAIFSA